MDTKKLAKDLFTLNFTDLNKRWQLLVRKIKRMVASSQIQNAADIPFVINNRNRLHYLRQVVEAAERIGFKRIYIIDNDSTYVPLLEYYATCQHQVIFLKRNGGPRSIWESPETRHFLRDFYIYTDPDVVPDPSVDMTCFQTILEKLKPNYRIDKIGLGLHIDDLPNHFALKNEVIAWEKQFHQHVIDAQFFFAPVDTTLAVYAPFAQGGGECKAWRTRAPWLAKHLPWYENSALPDEETLYYRNHAASSASHWTELTKGNEK